MRQWSFESVPDLSLPPCMSVAHDTKQFWFNSTNIDNFYKKRLKVNMKINKTWQKVPVHNSIITTAL